VLVDSSSDITKAKMPLQREHIQFAVLFFSVPLQYLVVQHMGSSETSRTYAISQMVEDLNKLQNRWFRIEPWKRWCHNVLMSITESALSSKPHDPTNTVFDPNDELGESPALEVMKYRETQQFFGQSTIVRYPKAPHIQFRVGQVVKHKKWGYRGVIIAWDETAKAPEEWLKAMHKENKEWRNQPNYSILVDTRDRQAPQMTYVPQENIEVIKNTKVLHPSVEDYFEKFDGSQYLPRPWLKTVYPRD